MANYYSDPTANAAVSSIEKDMKRMARTAEKIAARYKKGIISLDELEMAEKQFTGIYRNLLRNALIKAEEKEKSADKDSADTTR